MNPDLAINGGRPAIDTPPPQWPTTEAPIRESVMQALADGSWGKYDSKWTEQLIERLKDQYQVEHVLPCSSGTIAVELGLRGLEINPDSEVIMAGYDFPGNFRAIEAVQAFPVLADVVKGGWVLDPHEVKAAISPTTAAVIVSHLHGQIAPIQELRQLLEPSGIPILEDVCQMPGGKIESRPLGSFGEVAALSFGGSKLLSAGRGGALLTNSAEIFQRAKIYNSRGNEAFPLSQLQAAVLGPQLDRIDSLNQQRHERALQIIDKTNDNPILHTLSQVIESDSCLPAYYKLPWLFEDIKSGWPRGDFVNAIKAEGVAIDVGFRGFTRRSNRRCRQVGALLHSRIASQQTVILHHPTLLQSEDYTDSVCRAIDKVTAAL